MKKVKTLAVAFGIAVACVAILPAGLGMVAGCFVCAIGAALIN